MKFILLHAFARFVHDKNAFADEVLPQAVYSENPQHLP